VRPAEPPAYLAAYLALPKTSSVEFAALVGSAQSARSEATASEVLELLASAIGWSKPSRESRGK